MTQGCETVNYPAAASYVLLGLNWHLEEMDQRKAGCRRGCPAVRAEITTVLLGWSSKAGTSWEIGAGRAAPCSPPSQATWLSPPIPVTARRTLCVPSPEQRCPGAQIDLLAGDSGPLDKVLSCRALQAVRSELSGTLFSPHTCICPHRCIYTNMHNIPDVCL